MYRHSVDADTAMLMDDLSWVVLLDTYTHACARVIVPVPTGLCHQACAIEPVPSSLCHRACAIKPVPSIANPVADDNENDDDTKLNQMEAWDDECRRWAKCTCGCNLQSISFVNGHG